jgi:hypothetical protein
MLMSKDLSAITQAPTVVPGLLDSGVPASMAVAVPGMAKTGLLHNEYGGL